MKHLGARFIREGPPLAATTSGETLHKAALAALPSSLRTELADGVASLDSERIAATVRHVAEVNPVLGGILGQYAGRLQYTAILRALEAIG